MGFRFTGGVEGEGVGVTAEQYIKTHFLQIHPERARNIQITQNKHSAVIEASEGGQILVGFFFLSQWFNCYGNLESLDFGSWGTFQINRSHELIFYKTKALFCNRSPKIYPFHISFPHLFYFYNILYSVCSHSLAFPITLTGQAGASYPCESVSQAMNSWISTPISESVVNCAAMRGKSLWVLRCPVCPWRWHPAVDLQ